MAPRSPQNRFRAQLWIWSASGQASWYFVTLPTDLADDIADSAGGARRRGFGSVPVEATLGPTTWRTSVFPSREHGSYLLPVKKAVRAAAEAGEGDLVDVTLTVLAGT